jgi:cysteine-rich repeat protein
LLAPADRWYEPIMAWTVVGGERAGLVATSVVALLLGCTSDSGQGGATDAASITAAVDTTTTDPSTTAEPEPTTTAPAGLCGNGVLDPGEACDDGNLDNSDACLNDCTQAVCGDGFVQLGVEECDDGNQQDDDGCTNACVVGEVQLCGNGVLDPGEECDDGNTFDDDNCLSTCVPYSCGDGVTHAVFEECDDGNDDDGDACVGCLHATCGDGYLHVGVEACDDGNLDNTDDCLVTCAAASCGDAFVHKTDEACDDGVNDGSYGGCEPGCLALAPRCGDGELQPEFETCDDGNTIAGDGCDDLCQQELPPECLGYVELAEADRSVTFNDGPGKVTKCDKQLGDHWYRFVTPAGVMLPSNAPKPFACGTDAPGWMLGVHPTEEEGVVERQVCFAWDTDCDWQTTIQVRNCGAYFVYKLANPPEECLRYCGTE